MGFLCAIVNDKFLEVGNDTDGKVGTPTVPSELKGGLIGGRTFAKIDARLFCFDEKYPLFSDPEGIIGGSACSVADESVFESYGSVTGSEVFFVFDVPAESGEEGIDEIFPALGFVVLGTFIVFLLPMKFFDESLYFLPG
jgi:hypothetical protein